MGGESGGGGGVVEIWELSHNGSRWVLLVLLAIFVFEDGSGGGVVEGGVEGGVVGGGSHVVVSWLLVGCQKDIGGLSGSDHNHICCEWFGVRRVDGHHRQLVVSDGEEQLLIQC